MSSWPPLALAVWVGAAGACLAAEPGSADGRANVAAPTTIERHAPSLDLALRGVGLDDAAPGPRLNRVQAETGHLQLAESERLARLLDLHLGRSARAGRSPGEAPPLYGEVGIDLDPFEGLSIVPSYRVVLDQPADRPDSGTIGAQVLKLGARIHF